MKLTNKSKVFRITFLGLCVGLYIALSFATIRLPYQEITFKGFSVVLVSVVSGPLDGAIVATCGEFINQLTGPYGLTPTTPLWILPHVVRALIVGFMMRKKDVIENQSAWVLSVILSGIAVTLVNSLVIWLDALIFNYPAALTVITIVLRAAIGIVVSAAYALIIPPLISALKKLNKIERKKDSK